MNNLRRIIEDYASFEAEYPDVKDFETPDTADDRLRSNNPQIATRIKDIKKLWNKHVDRQFIQSLVKIHWLEGTNYYGATEAENRIKKFLKDVPRNDEISIGLYAKNSYYNSYWGEIGIVLDGRITFASNDMNTLYTGGWSDVDAEKEKAYRKTSGIPRRATVVFPKKTLNLSHYILDGETFNEDDSSQNEGIIDNWKPISIIIRKPNEFGLTRANRLSKDTNLPIIDSHGKILINPKAVTIESFVREILTEKSRYEKETGNDFSNELRQKILSLASDSCPVPYAFTMINVPKIGINPKTSYETPAGVYFYPLTELNVKKLISNTLPFASNAKYFGVVKLKHLDSKKWLKFLYDQTDFQSEEDYERVIKAVGKRNHRKAATHGKHNYFNTDARIFDLTWAASEEETKFDNYTGKAVLKKPGRQTSRWNKLLRQLGYIGIYDEGYGIVHPSEPTQVVALSPEAYETIGIWETKELRKTKEDVSQLAGMSASKKIELLKRKFVPAETLNILSKDEVDYIRREVAANISCPAEILSRLSNDSNYGVRYTVAENPNCPVATLISLSKDPSFPIRCTVAENPNCSIATLNMLTKDSNFSVSNTAIEILNKQKLNK